MPTVTNPEIRELYLTQSEIDYLKDKFTWSFRDFLNIYTYLGTLSFSVFSVIMAVYVKFRNILKKKTKHTPCIAKSQLLHVNKAEKRKQAVKGR